MLRRTFSALGAAATAAALAPTPAYKSWFAPANSIRVDDRYYPVTSTFMRETGTPYPKLLHTDYEDLARQRDALLKLSNLRNTFQAPMPALELMAPNGTLTRDEQALLDATVRAINVHHGVRFLRGRELAEFRFTGADQVHGLSHGLACGCSLHTVIDHNLRAVQPITHHPHYPRFSCAKHAPIADWKRRHLQALEDAKVA
jgi:hypothetical protein